MLRHARARADGPILACVGHKTRIQFDALVGARFEHTAHAQLCVAFHGVAQIEDMFRIGSRADHRKIRGTVVEQVLRGETRLLNIIRGDVVRLVVRGSRAHADQRIIHVQILGIELLDFGNGQDHAIRHCGVEVPQERAGTLRGSFGVGGDVYGIAVDAGRVDHPVGQFGQIWRGQARHRERDEAGFAAIEVAGRHVDAVAEPVDDVLHFFACGVGHAAGMVDDVRRGFEGDSGLLRHFTQCDAFPVGLVRPRIGHVSP